MPAYSVASQKVCRRNFWGTVRNAIDRSITFVPSVRAPRHVPWFAVCRSLLFAFKGCHPLLHLPFISLAGRAMDRPASKKPSAAQVEKQIGSTWCQELIASFFVLKRQARYVTAKNRLSHNQTSQPKWIAFSSPHLALRLRSSHHRRRHHFCSRTSTSRGSMIRTCRPSFLPILLLPSAAATTRGVTMCPCLPHPARSSSRLLWS